MYLEEKLMRYEQVVDYLEALYKAISTPEGSQGELHQPTLRYVLDQFDKLKEKK